MAMRMKAGRKHKPSGRTMRTPAFAPACVTRSASERRRSSAACRSSELGAAPQRPASSKAVATGRQTGGASAQALRSSTPQRSAAFEEVAAAWQLSARHGCPLADAMEGAARSVRARRSHRACVDGATAGAKASTSVLLGLPVLGVGLGMLLGVDMLGCYSGFSGLVTLWPGIALMFVGARWSRRMTASALKAPTEAATS